MPGGMLAEALGFGKTLICLVTILVTEGDLQLNQPEWLIVGVCALRSLAEPS